MKTLEEKLKAAQQYAMTIRPKVGGFPYLAEALRQAGVKLNRWSLPSCQSVYIMNEGSVVQVDTPLVIGTYEVPKFDQKGLISAIRVDQQGKSTLPEFLKATWNAGVIDYEVDFERRTVTYFGVNGEKYEENYPSVSIS